MRNASWLRCEPASSLKAMSTASAALAASAAAHPRASARLAMPAMSMGASRILSSCAASSPPHTTELAA